MQQDFDISSVNLKAQEGKLKDFVKQTGLQKDSNRVQTLGFDRSTAQKAVWADKKSFAAILENSRKSDKIVLDTFMESMISSKSFAEVTELKGKLSDRAVRKWYLAKDEKIHSLIDKSKNLEEQALQAFTLRKQYRTQARDLMRNQKARAELDKTDPNKSFEELIQCKISSKGLNRNEAVLDILKTATKTRVSVNKKFGLE